MQSRLRIVSLLSLILVAAPAGAQSVAYEKYKLPNGLTVILHQDHSLPVAGVNMWYHVGSKDEKERRSGFAHLFEHLMFMGTRRVPGSEFDFIMESGGGWNNASTSEDRTNYYEMGPSELLPTLLWLEADRLEELGKEMTQEKLDKQRAVVRNERRQSYENAPYGKSELHVYEIMFPKGHPYHIPVIGTHEDLEAATVDDVKNFFANYYVPSNASLVVAGDFDPAVIKPIIADLFASLPRGSDVLHAKADPVKLSSVTRTTETDTVQFARTSMVYHSPAHFQPGDAEMDLAAAVLSEGISSRLYQELIYKRELATEVHAMQSSMLLGSLFYIQATAKPGVALDDIEKAIDEVVADFVAKGPKPDELERQKAQIEYRMISRLQSLLEKADRLNEYEYFFGEPDSFKRDLDRYRSATVDGVKQWAAKTFTPEARLIQRVIPEIEATPGGARESRPGLATTDPYAPLMPETFQLANGVTVHHWRRTEWPLVAVKLLLPTGSVCDPPSKSGLEYLTADMLDEGAGDRSAVQFADALDQLGATFGTNVDLESASVNLTVLSRNFDKAMELYADALLHPRFDEKEWQRVHSLHIEELIQNQDEPREVAQVVAMRSFFGDANPYSRPPEGTPDDVRKLTLDDVKGFYKRWCSPAHAVILTAGDLSVEQMRSQLEQAFSRWKPIADAAPLSPPSIPAPANDALRLVIVDRPDAVQTVVRFVMPASNYADPNRTRLELLNTILGGSFTSRLNQNLRERNGYTYGARSGYTMNPSAGYFIASSSVRSDVTGASIKEFLNEFNSLRGGNMTAAEVQKSGATNRMAIVQSFQGLSGILNTAAVLVRNNRPFSALGDELASFARMTDADLNKLAHDAVPLERALLVLVGDKKQIMEQIRDLKLPAPVELTVTGEPVKQ